MKGEVCPNHKGCQVINIEGFVESAGVRDFYISDFCEASQDKWSECKRFQTKRALAFCPDFVLPDSNLTLDEIIDKIETEL